MSLLRIYAESPAQTSLLRWSLVAAGREPAVGECLPAGLPRQAGRVQLVIPAAQVLITRTRLPPASRRRGGSVLAFAIEEKTVGEPEANQVSWLGMAGDEDVLAVTALQALKHWHKVLGAAGIDIDEVHCETLLLPIQTGAWSLAWNGSEGFVRCGQLEGAATDCGDARSPPLSLRLMLDEAGLRGHSPSSLTVYPATPEVAPDIAAWQDQLGVSLQLAAPWDWRQAPPGAGISLTQAPRRWRFLAAVGARLRPAAWVLGAAMALHGIALATDWMLLAGEQRDLRRQMEAQFRAAFPDAVAVADPALQMRRKLAAARHAAGIPDGGDFIPMIGQVAAAARDLPPGAVRALAYEGGRLRLKIAAGDASLLQRFEARLMQAGIAVERPQLPDGGGATLILVLRAT